MSISASPDPRPTAARSGLSDAGIRALMGYNLKRAYMAFVPANHAAIAEYGLKVQSFTCLSLIDENPGLAPSELAEYLRIERSNLVAILTDLTARGLIERARAHADKRRIALRLTAQGHALYRAAYAALTRSEAEITKGLSPQETAQLIQLLRRIETHQSDCQKDTTE